MFLIFLCLFNICFSDIKVGGSLYAEYQQGASSDYVRGALSMFNSLIDKKDDFAVNAQFYDNNNNSYFDIANTRKLIFSDKAQILFGYTSFDSIKEAVKVGNEQNVPLIFPMANLSNKQLSELNIITLKPTIEEDIDKIVEFLEGEDNIIVIYDADKEWEKDYLISKQKADAFAYENSKFNEIIVQIKRKNPKYIVVLSDSLTAIKIIKGAQFSSLDASFVLPYYATNATFKKSLMDREIKVFACRIFPDLASEDDLVIGYKRNAQKYRAEFPVNESGLEGYITAKAIVDLAQDRSIQEGIANFNKYDYINLRVDKYN